MTGVRAAVGEEFPMNTKYGLSPAKLFVCLVTACILSSCSSDIDTGAADDQSITDHLVSMSNNGKEYKVTVRVPSGYVSTGDQKFPTLFHIIDDEDAFNLTAETIAELADSRKIPAMIIVSLHASDSEEYSPNWGEEKPKAFLKFLRADLMPFLTDKYRVSDDVIFTGWSRFGLFTAYTLAQNPSLFRGYIVRSIAANGSGGSDLQERIQSDLDSYLMANQSADQRFYFTVGARETGRIEGFNTLKRMLESQAPSSFKWGAKIINEARHFDTLQAGLHDGLLFYFSAVDPTTVK